MLPGILGWSNFNVGKGWNYFGGLLLATIYARDLNIFSASSLATMNSLTLVYVSLFTSVVAVKKLSPHEFTQK